MDYFVSLFSANRKSSKGDIRSNARAMSKLSMEAERVMKILSANTETIAQVESLFENEDFKAKITRTDFETICHELFERISVPIFSALEAAQLPLPAIKEVILMGGGSRIPKVQDILMKITGKTELGKGINTDEAAALGAVYQAAYHSPGFRVMRFIVKDASPYAIAVGF
ncbi:unnamed protein product [Protopolystoma xenopodis]|uniref:Hypoxia up-regulated protein 1 n=1 Tax=Protopolystoma xenopodis TaxID=117903 RepID=A0A448WD81_9PLAT|nr:unnamed protein product [Protopolystoma xenopodis]